MNKAKWLKLANTALFISFLIQVYTSIMLLFFKETEFINETHKYNGILLIVLVAVHITLNWNWVKAAFFKKK